MNVIKATYQFLVGDQAILVGVIMTVGVLAVLNTVPALTRLKVASGVILDFSGAHHPAGHTQARNRTVVLAHWRPKEAPMR